MSEFKNPFNELRVNKVNILNMKKVINYIPSSLFINELVSRELLQSLLIELTNLDREYTELLENFTSNIGGSSSSETIASYDKIENMMNDIVTLTDALNIVETKDNETQPIAQSFNDIAESTPNDPPEQT